MDEEPKPRTPYLGRLALVMLVTLVAVVVVRVVVAQISGFVVPGGATAVLPPIAGAIHVGQVWGRGIGAVPPGPAMWRFALAGGLVHLTMRLPLALLAASGLQRPGDVLGLLLTLEAGVLVVSVLVIRFLVANAARAGAGPAR